MTAPLLAVWSDPDPADVGDTVEAFLARLEGPTAIRFGADDDTRCRAVVTLLHGNEPSGVRALHALLREGFRPRVRACCVVAAVDAARLAPGFAHRMSPGRADLNRCFGPAARGREGDLAAAILGLLQAARPEAIVDLHNNSGHNPPYGVSTALDEPRLRLTGLFAERYVHTDIVLGSLMEATATIAPTVTIECGRAGDPAADATARAGLARFLAATDLAALPVPALRILTHPLRVSVRPGVRLAFGDAPTAAADLTLARDVDRHNFEELASGTAIGWIGAGSPWPLEAHGRDGRDLSRDLFSVREGVLCTRQPLTPIMMTTDAQAAAADCLFYAVPRPSPSADPPSAGGREAGRR